MLGCLVNGCVVPEAELARLVLWAIVVGVGTGVMFSTILSKALDLVLLVIERRHRIEAARTRDHSKVPSIHVQRFDALQQRIADRFIGPL